MFAFADFVDLAFSAMWIFSFSANAMRLIHYFGRKKLQRLGSLFDVQLIMAKRYTCFESWNFHAESASFRIHNRQGHSCGRQWCAALFPLSCARARAWLWESCKQKNQLCTRVFVLEFLWICFRNNTISQFRLLFMLLKLTVFRLEMEFVSS